MPSFKELQEERKRQFAAVGAREEDDRSIGVEIMNEMVKSYGLKYDEASEEWSWNTENYKTAWKEDPVWTAIDHLTLAVPVAKWGTAAAAVARGAQATNVASRFAKGASALEKVAIAGRAGAGAALGAAGGSLAEGEEGSGAGTVAGAVAGAVVGGLFGVRAVKSQSKVMGKALASGAFEGKTAETRIGRLFGKEMGVAVEKQLEQSPSGPVSKFFRNYGANGQLTKEDLALYDRFGFDKTTGHLEPGLDKHIIKGLQNSEIMGRAANRRLRDEAIALADTAKLTPEGQFRFRTAMREATLPDNYAAKAGVPLDPGEAELFNKTFTIREQLQQNALELGMISPETYARTLNTYHPREYEELLNMAEGAGPSAPARALTMNRTIRRETTAVRRATDEVTETVYRNEEEVAVLQRDVMESVYKHEDMGLTEIMDPKTSLNSLMDSLDKLVRIKFLRGIQQSPLVKQAETFRKSALVDGEGVEKTISGLLSKFKVKPVQSDTYKALLVVGDPATRREAHVLFEGGLDAEEYLNNLRRFADQGNVEMLEKELSKVLKDKVGSVVQELDVSDLAKANATRLMTLKQRLPTLQKGSDEWHEAWDHYNGVFQQVKDKIMEDNGWVRFDDKMSRVKVGDAIKFSDTDRWALGVLGKKLKALETTPDYATKLTRQKEIQAILDSGTLTPEATAKGMKDLEAVRRELDPLAKEIAEVQHGIAQIRKNAAYKDEFRSLSGRLDDHYIEKHVADDLNNFYTPGPANPSAVEQYKSIMGAFRIGKTGYNPATWVRNHLGNMMSHSFVTGFNEGNLVPWKGAEAFAKGSDEWKNAVQAGILDGDFITEEVKYAFQHLDKWEGKSILEKIHWGMANDAAFKKLHPKWEPVKWYANIDKVSRLDAWIRAKGKYAKRGLSVDEATNSATRDVFRYYANFDNQSDFVNMARQVVPFSGFGAEAARFTKNALIYKPHMVFAWNHMTDAIGHAAAMATGISAEDIEEAKSHLPNYTEGKKMFVIPWRDQDGKVQFMDMSYILPLGDTQNKSQGKVGDAFFAAPVLEMFNPMNNPVVSTMYAATTGKDAYTDQPIRPGFTEGQLGIDIESDAMRKNVGLVEHITRTMMPPLMPPGYVGINILQAIRGTKDRRTGEPIQDPLVGGEFPWIGDSTLANLLGIRKYKPSVKAEAQNLYQEGQLSNEKRARLWDKWEQAVANKDSKQEETARGQILEALRKNSKSAAKARKDFKRGTKAHKPGGYENVSEAGLNRLLKAAGTPQERAAIRKRLLKLKKNKRS